MNRQERIESLLLVKAQLEEWMSHQPEFHFKLHTNKDINIAYQRCKKLIDYEIMSGLDDASDECLSLHNMN